MKDVLKDNFKKKRLALSLRHVLITLVVLFVCTGVLLTGVVVQAISYSNKVIPGLYLGDVAIGGMSSEELGNFLQSMNDKLLNEGFSFYFDNDGKKEKFKLSPVIVTEDMVIELMLIDVEKEVDRIMNYGKEEEGVFARALSFERSRFLKPSIGVEHIIVDYEKINSEIEERLEKFKKDPIEASVNILSLDPLKYEMIKSRPGTIFKFDEAVEDLVDGWSVLKIPEIKIDRVYVEPSLDEGEVLSIISRLPFVFEEGGVTITYKDPQNSKLFEWNIDTEKISKWINVQETSNSKYGFGLEKQYVVDYLLSFVNPKVSVEARDAKFLADDTGLVKEFQSSRPGIKLDIDETYDALNEAILQRTRHDEGVTKTIQLVVEKIEPNTTTGEANDLGISEVLGVGISDFTGSPVNRIKNIKNGAKKLNGLMIGPDEEFSAIKYTQPYTEEGGYLPELVIKGDSIKPEIGGGLCQIGTTLFRMAMNGAMDITYRRNHSLIVDYYNDLDNGLPGTDATIYEPFPDFKFRNDTDDYVLIQTEVDEENFRLIFTLWGTKTGRKGWYDPPVVEEWIPYGEKKYVETTSLPVGGERCQHAFRGAKANFKYTRELENGEKEETVFESYYRPLPEICLVGVEEKPETCFGDDGREVECKKSEEESELDTAGDTTEEENLTVEIE
jgi:vancomycin resistance protein YoaR